MRLFRRLALLFVITLTGQAHAQGAVTQLLSGELVQPRAGVWAWYELEDAATGERYYLRQAIVGVTRERKKTGYWLELQVRPQVGFPTTYKMLLTGPATDPANIRRIYFQTGNEPVQRLEPKAEEQAAPLAEAAPEPLGEQTVPTPNGPVVCKHYKMPDGSEMWLSDAVPPMGIVRIKSPEGELRLQRFGEGGPDALTALPTEEDGKMDSPSSEADAPERPANALPPAVRKEETSTEPVEPKRNFRGRGGKP